MQTQLAPAFQGTADGQAAEAILRKCVHCGFCTATCPTYQVLGDELDSPRGRIYLIKQVLEGQTPTRSTQLHLDRCLTCRNCESTCPSGVQYGQLIDIGRKLVDAQVPRPLAERATRWVLKEGLTSPLFGPAMQLGQAVRALLPEGVRANSACAGRVKNSRWIKRLAQSLVNRPERRRMYGKTAAKAYGLSATSYKKRSTATRQQSFFVQGSSMDARRLHPAQRAVPLDQRRRDALGQRQHWRGVGHRQAPHIQRRLGSR